MGSWAAISWAIRDDRASGEGTRARWERLRCLFSEQCRAIPAAAMDNASPSNLRSLKLLARDLIADESDEIDAICEALT